MTMRGRGARRAGAFGALFALPALLSPAGAVSAGEAAPWLTRGWQAKLYAGPLTTQDTSEIFLKGEWTNDAGIVGAALAKEIFDWEERFAVDLELSLGRRFGGQRLTEGAIQIMGRWQALPWDGILDTDITVGYGGSMASEVPEEVRQTEGDVGKFLGSLVVELAFALPENPARAFLVRYQHRSSAFGALGGSGAQDETTAITFGLRYRFGM